MADKALRVLAVAYLDTEKPLAKLEPETVERDLVFARSCSE